MDTLEFLKTVVTTDAGYLCLAHANQDIGWQESFYEWPKQQAEVISAAVRADTNVYFSAHLFSEKSSRREFVLPSRTIQADLDYADTITLPVLPTVLVCTSPGRHQAFWVANTSYQVEHLEALSRRIAYGVPNCDITGWTAGHRVRLPGSSNFKYKTPAKIEIVNLNLRELENESFNAFPITDINVTNALLDFDWVNADPKEFNVGPQELIAGLRGRLPAMVVTQYNTSMRDRSAALWQLTCELFKLELDRDLVYFLASHSKNNKFEGRKYHAIRDLRKDVLRAELSVKTKRTDLRALILEIRIEKDKAASEKKKAISHIILHYMRENGEFVHTKSGALWYVRKETGRPISITNHSEWLNAYLASNFSLNATETEQRYVIQELIAHCRSLPESPNLQLLSYYDAFTRKLLLHTGGRDVIHVGAQSIETHPNGHGNVTFMWASSTEIFRLDKPTNEAWYEILFAPSLDNILILDRDEAMAILRSWFLFLLFRNMPTTRPILALLGQQGSGKTTIANRLYRLIYGRTKHISGVIDSESFDMAVSHNPFVTFDNLDTWEKWLPDKLALSASITDIERRKLYTDNDMLVLQRSAMLCITAHNPKFVREDVTDRLLLFMFKRLDVFKDDTELLESVSRIRNRLWGSIVEDVQRVLRTPKPDISEAPQFRIFDFAYLGLWFARAGSPELERAFKSAIYKISGSQRSFNIEEEQLLVGAIRTYVSKMQNEPVFTSITGIWNALNACASDTDLFRRSYKNAITLGKKLMAMQPSLKEYFTCEFTHDTHTGTRVWKIGPKS